MMRAVLVMIAAVTCWAQGPEGRDPNASTVWVNQPKSGSLPRGVTHHTYRSASMNPVFYNLGGAGGNELHGQLAAEILHEGIARKRWPPMILVMPNGGKFTFYKDSADGRYKGETTLIRELIPHIDSTYRTIAAREGRAIEGFSMGGRGATRLALKYPEMFCSLFNQAGNVFHISEMFDPSQREKYPNNYLGPDKARYLADDPYLLLKKNLAAIKGRMRIQVACGTADDGHLPSVRDFHQALLAAGVDHTYIEIEGLAHKQSEMLELYRPIWFDYHAESFRRASLQR